MENNVCRMCRTGLGALVALVLALPLRGASANEAQEVSVFAASSLASALQQIETGFEAETGFDLVVSLAGSSVLARQIEQGAPADIFISANPGWMDRLGQRGLLEPGSRRDLLRNELVLVAHDPDAVPLPLTDAAALQDRLGQGRLAMALVDAVPAGIYGKAALMHLGLWDGISAQVAQADNVRAALALVATGAAPLGVVYATDAQAEPRVTVIARFPADSHPPIVYPVAEIAGRDTPAEAAFLAYLDSPAARAIFAAQGFGVIGD